ncbi:FYVE-domain-containing protein [Violaceomyces palustris]|uniref:FYVE-domain-containing protein n=1 Tax=Violaceomyces palustris TaxID=1673888 RepID=A0ACD0P0J3_9BASI|nr:FYVE-domain-containing protein [Violaceomyces palustris]
MNAASKGHLPIVRYLTAKHHADPFIRNAAGETAFDVAAATFEIYICEVLEKYEAERWNAGPYNPLALHTTIPIILHENQRLDTRLKTLAINGARPRWSSTSAARPHKPDRRAPSQPYKLRLPARGGPNSAAGRRKAASVLNARKVSDPSTGGGKGQAESSHFWLSEWQQDLTHPLVGVEDGWQYSQSFDALDDRWSASIPPPLARLLDGRGLSASVTRAITGGATMASGQGDQEAAQSGWVRRRRWVRVMRRRLDIEFGDDLEASEFASGSVTNHSSGNDDASSPSDLPTAAVITAQEAARVECAELGPDADYVKRAQALAGKSASHGSTPADSISENRDEIARRIARLEMAITELRSSAFSDEDVERRGRAEDLLKEFTVQLGQMRQAFGLEEEDELSDLDDEEFIYPNSYKDDGASVFTRIPATNESSSHAAAGPSRPVIPQRHSSSASVFGAAASADVILSAGARSADLAASRSFRVPTNEAPNKVVYGRGPVLREQNLLPQWERDTDVNECRGCSRRFTFFVRKHHCRRCGKIFCDSCSSRRAHLDVSEMVVDPSLPGMAQAEAMGVSRICDNCNADRQLPPALQSLRGIDALTPRRSSVGGGTGAGVGSTVFGGIEHEHGDDGRGFDPAVAASDVSSRASELNECPVCSITLAGLGEAEAQEEHVRNCLENGGGGTMQGGRYLVYKLPDNSPIVGKECLICMEDFVGDNMIARLPCLCYFHRACIDSWFKKGRECPVHARTW